MSRSGRKRETVDDWAALRPARPSRESVIEIMVVMIVNIITAVLLGDGPGRLMGCTAVMCMAVDDNERKKENESYCFF